MNNDNLDIEMLNMMNNDNLINEMLNNTTNYDTYNENNYVNDCDYYNYPNNAGYDNSENTNSNYINRQQYNENYMKVIEQTNFKQCTENNIQNDYSQENYQYEQCCNNYNNYYNTSSYDNNNCDCNNYDNNYNDYYTCNEHIESNNCAENQNYNNYSSYQEQQSDYSYNQETNECNQEVVQVEKDVIENTIDDFDSNNYEYYMQHDKGIEHNPDVSDVVEEDKSKEEEELTSTDRVFINEENENSEYENKEENYNENYSYDNIDQNNYNTIYQNQQNIDMMNTFTRSTIYNECVEDMQENINSFESTTTDDRNTESIFDARKRLNLTKVSDIVGEFAPMEIRKKAYFLDKLLVSIPLAALFIIYLLPSIVETLKDIFVHNLPVLNISHLIGKVIGYIIFHEIIYCLYYVVIPLLFKGQTFGKKKHHLRVVSVDVDNPNVTIEELFKREMLYKKLESIFFIGYMKSYKAPDMIARHDRKSNTRVIIERPVDGDYDINVSDVFEREE